MIYIDPPYNTGKDFIYADNYVEDMESFLISSTQVDDEGNRLVQNTDGNGRFHTDWLNMIYPRLHVAKDLLSNDGVIFISIDENEYGSLLKVCNEIFGSANYVGTIILQTATDNNPRQINIEHGFLIACFDNDVTEETVKAVAQEKPYYAVFRDSSIANDSVATNFEQIFATYSPETVRKVL